jgi:hypothetical protein
MEVCSSNVPPSVDVLFPMDVRCPVKSSADDFKSEAVHRLNYFVARRQAVLFVADGIVPDPSFLQDKYFLTEVKLSAIRILATQFFYTIWDLIEMMNEVQIAHTFIREITDLLIKVYSTEDRVFTDKCFKATFTVLCRMGRFPKKHFCYNLLVTWCFSYYRPVRDKMIMALFFEQMFPFLIKLSVDFWDPIEKILGDRTCHLFLVCSQKCLQLASTSKDDPVTSFLAANIEVARNKLEASGLDADIREVKKWFMWFADFCNVMDHPDAEPWLPESPKYNEACHRAHDELLDVLSGLDHYLKLDKKGASKMGREELVKMNADAQKLLNDWLRSATLAASVTVKVGTPLHSFRIQSFQKKKQSVQVQKLGDDSADLVFKKVMDDFLQNARSAAPPLEEVVLFLASVRSVALNSPKGQKYYFDYVNFMAQEIAHALQVSKEKNACLHCMSEYLLDDTSPLDMLHLKPIVTCIITRKRCGCTREPTPDQCFVKFLERVVPLISLRMDDATQNKSLFRLFLHFYYEMDCAAQMAYAFSKASAKRLRIFVEIFTSMATTKSPTIHMSAEFFKKFLDGIESLKTLPMFTKELEAHVEERKCDFLKKTTVNTEGFFVFS